jgi:hypothetical protein
MEDPRSIPDGGSQPPIGAPGPMPSRACQAPKLYGISPRVTRKMRRSFVAAIALAIFAHPINAAELAPCALSAAQRFVISAQCASFRTRQIHVIAQFTPKAFAGGHQPGTIASLADGVVVEVGPNGLFLINSDGRISEMWAPRQSSLPYPPLTITPWPGQPTPTPPPGRPNYTVELLGAFNQTAVFQYASTWVYGASENGSVDFRFPRLDYATTTRPSLIGRDPEGTVWLDSWSTPLQRDLIYAFRPKTDRLDVLPVTVENAFQGPYGFILRYVRKGRRGVALHSSARSALCPRPNKATGGGYFWHAEYRRSADRIGRLRVGFYCNGARPRASGWPCCRHPTNKTSNNNHTPARAHLFSACAGWSRLD